jgi:hypothetical protein
MSSDLASRICTTLRAAAVFGLVSLLSIGSASASSFQIVGGQAYTLESDFNPNWISPPPGLPLAGNYGPNPTIQIFYGADGTGTNASNSSQVTNFTSPTPSGAGLVINGASGSVNLIYTFLGFEAAYTNQAEPSFTYSSTAMFTNQTTPLGTSDNVSVALPSSGLVPFLFASTAYSSGGVAVNGGPIGSNVGLGFLIDPFNSSIAYAFLEDIWSNGDADFDDMVVQIQIDPTPLPVSLLLFATGLGAAVLFGWRRKRKATAVMSVA